MQIPELETVLFVSQEKGEVSDYPPQKKFNFFAKKIQLQPQVLGALAMIDDGELDWSGILVSLREAVTIHSSDLFTCWCFGVHWSLVKPLGTSHVLSPQKVAEVLGKLLDFG